MVMEIRTPPIIVFGQGALSRLPQLLQQAGVSHPLLVTGRAMPDRPIFATLASALEAASLPYGLYAEVTPDPDLKTVQGGVAAFRAGNYDGLVGFGGGSALDAAKAINLALHSDGDLRRWKVPQMPSFPVLPLICIPTTAGTGSEVTRVIVVTDPDTHEKMLFMGPSCMPTAALVDPDTTLQLPRRLVADTGLDALTHALEAYVSRKHNPHADVMALSALRQIGGNLREAFTTATEVARNGMMLAALHAGIAFSNASVALVHGLSRPLGGVFGVPHGTANAILLAEVTRFSVPAAESRYAECARALGFASATDSTNVAGQKLVEGIETLVGDLQVPSLAQLGIQQNEYFSRIPLMAEQAIVGGSPANNPRQADVAQLQQIYSRIWR